VTRVELRNQLIALLKSVAPEVEEDELRTDRALRNQIDLDSMDWLKFLVAIHESLKVDIPEADYRKLVTLDDISAYIEARAPAP
jgi:acyl carrier protein